MMDGVSLDERLNVWSEPGVAEATLEPGSLLLKSSAILVYSCVFLLSLYAFFL